MSLAESDLTHSAQIAQIIGTCVSTIGLLIASAAIWFNCRVSIQNQRMAAIMHCNLRYDSLYTLKSSINKIHAPTVVTASGTANSRGKSVGAPKNPTEDTSESEVEYFRRYWGLQSDQIDYWLLGYIDPDTMACWLVNMAKNLRDQKRKVGKKSYTAGWEAVHVDHDGPNQLLVNLVDKNIRGFA